MLKKTFLALLATLLLSTGANAESLAMGTSFQCANDIGRTTGLDGTVTCIVLNDVFSFFDKTLTFPAGTKMVGKRENGEVTWASVIVPHGWVVTIPTEMFATRLEGAQYVLMTLVDAEFHLE